MTDEELFKVYIKRELCVHCRFPQFCKGEGDCSDISTAKRHYLAGVEAGKSLAETDLATIAYMQGAERYKTKWHDLRKDPNDLPRTLSTVLDENGDKITYCGGGMWTVYSDYYEKDIDVEPPKAWCEIPTFKEVKENEN